MSPYQIKWGEYETRVTFRSLVTGSGPSTNPQPSLLAQLADGWRRLTRAEPHRTAHVHLLMRASASDADDVGGTGQHFQAFLRHAWAARATWTADERADATAGWSSAIATLIEATGLDAGTFGAFAPCAHLHLGHRLATTDPNDRAGRRRDTDIDHLAGFLFRLVADDRRTVQMNRADLVRQLGWARRLDLRFRHDFPVDDRLYRPISGTVSEVEAALGAFDGGYLALVGTPGSGKSTTLTQMLRYRPRHRVIRYYAFVRGDTAQGRGEAEAFLSDVTLAIRRSGVDTPGPSAMLAETRAELADLFGRQLAALHEDWRANGVKTLVLVDGLDHIMREQRPEHPLLDVLPSPNDVPDGVLLILGSQTVGLGNLTAGIRSQLGEAGRTLTMHRLDRRDVIEIAASSLPDGAVTDVDLDAVWTASTGHPLALAYLLKRLALASGADARRALLDATQPFSGEIERDYHKHWETLRADVETRELLGLLCRLRGSIDLDLIASLRSGAVLERFVASAAHFFHQETSNRWTFFHNSFRQFLLVATGCDPFGRPNAARSAAFHRQLAEACAGRAQTPLGWERLHHLHGAGDTQTVLQLFTQRYFREQFMALRSLPEIQDDIATCLHAALAEDDRVAVIRAFLVEQELRERNQALEDVDLPTLMLELADPADRADAAIRDGELAIPRGTALAFAGTLQDEGDPTLAHRLFDLAEPVAWLNGSRPVTTSHERTRLEAWAEVAWRFHPVDRLTRLIRQVRYAPEEDPSVIDGRIGATSTTSETPHDKSSLLLGITTSAALRAGADDAVAGLEAALAAIGDDQADMTRAGVDRLRAELAIVGDRPRAEGVAALDRLCKRWPPDVTKPQRMVSLALMLLRLGATRDRVEAYVGATPSVMVSGIGVSDDTKTLDDIIPLFAQARVLSTLGRPLDPVAAVPNDPRVHRHGAVLLQRMLVLVGTARGEADAGTLLSPGIVVRRLLPAINLYNRSWQDTRDWTDWHGVRGRAEAYFDLILRTAHAHGHAALMAVLECMTRGWTENTRHAWPAHWRRAVLLSAHALDGDRNRTISGLSALSDGGVWAGVHDRVAHHAGQLRAWLDLGERERARFGLAAMLQTSFGIYHRDDDQYERWCGWAARVATIQTIDRVGPVVLPLVRGMVVVHGDRRGHDPDATASILLEGAATVSPGWARDLLRWLLANQGTTRHDALAGLLKGVLARPPSARTDRNSLLAATHLIVPFETTTDDGLAVALGAAAHRAKPGAAAELERLLQAVATGTYPCNRATWRDGLARGILTVGGNTGGFDLITRAAVETGQTEPEFKPIGLTMREGGFVNLDAILGEHQTPARFAALAARATSAERLPWGTLLGTVLDGADGAAYAAVNRAITYLQPPLHVHAWFAGRFAELGRPSDARAAVDLTWAGSNPHGWLRHYDGGSRLIAADAAVLIDGEAGRRRVLEVLVRDYLGETRRPGELLRGLDRLVALLFADPPLEAIWSEVAEHAGQLVEVALSATLEPPEPFVEVEDGTLVLVDLAFDDLDHPVCEVADAARRFLIDLLRDAGNRPAIAECIMLRLATCGDAGLESTLALLCCALDVDVGWTRMFADELRRLATCSTSAIVTAHTGTLLLCLDREMPSRPRRPLPTIHTLRLPPVPMPNVGPIGKPRRGQPLDDTDDPVELAGSMEVPLAHLSRISGIPQRNLTSRLVALMPEIAPRASWDRAAEGRRQRDLEKAGLRIAYRRPRTAVARLAFGRMVQELVDADVVPWPVPDIGHWLFAVDPLVSMLAPSERPDWLAAPDADVMNAWSNKDWVRRPADCLADAPLRLPDGRLILAERTEWLRTDRGRPTEARATQVGPHGYPWIGNEEPDQGFFLRFPYRALGAEYPVMWPPDASVPPMPILEGGGWLRPTFLAFSPIIAFKLGWEPSAEGLFAWTDANSIRMVETLRWRDGNLLHLDRFGCDEVCGEGWVVLATVEGARELEPLFRGWRRYLVASRVTDEAEVMTRPVVARREQRLSPVGALDPITPGIRG